MQFRSATKRPITTVAVLGIVALLGGCASLAQSQRSPALEAVVVSVLRVDNSALEGAAQEHEWMAGLLATQATAAAQRAALEHRLAARVVQAPGARTHQLSGEVRMPTSLPVGVSGSRAAFREGSLVSAHFVLTDASGLEVASTDVELEWDDIRWTTGGPKLRRPRRTDLVLLDAAGKAVERGIGDLQRLAAAAAATAFSGAGSGAP